MRVLLAGASGLIGSALADSLRADGHEVRRLVRRPTTAPDESQWNPERRQLDPSAFDGVDVVVCLSGANVGGKRWTKKYKRVLRRSRVDSVGLLARAMSAHGDPKVFVTASAMGYYGDRGDDLLDESQPPGRGFQAELCTDWELAAEPASRAGIRVVHLRSGLVLAPQADLIKRVRLLTKACLSGPMGSGRQYWSWISLPDHVAATRFLIDRDDIRGAVNVSSPEPVRQADFAKTIARRLRRPSVLPAPRFGLRIVLGKFVVELVSSRRLAPRRLEEAGFTFQHPTLDEALTYALKK